MGLGSQRPRTIVNKERQEKNNYIMQKIIIKGMQLRSPNVHNINKSLNNEGVVQEGYSEDEVPLEEVVVVKEAAVGA